ncbi:MAG: tRNA uridine(34) 5-carboxymethylaminomethyl modification radical SAM/GNAT enzyme Elp3, partial [bacterium]
IFSNAEIIKELNSSKTSLKGRGLLTLLKRRAVRTMSGIAPVAVLTKPYACPGECAFCPSEKNVPQSYLSNEPAVMRAIRCKYDPYIQVQDRLRALIANGHKPEKIELIVIGGTWSVLPIKYKYWYMANCFRAANEFGRQSVGRGGALCPPIHEARNFSVLQKELIKEQKKNETAKYKIIGITFETRPDYISEKELIEMRELGCTRVEIGVQAIDDKILKLNKRGHGVQKIVEATALLRNFGFKITYHIMPGLPGSSPAKDLKMFKQLFSDERFQPDQIKFYPTVVTRGSLLYKWWRTGKYKPYSDKNLENLIIKCKAVVPRYVRIIRLIRDIPAESIEAGNTVTNLRQMMRNRGVKCECIRCRQQVESQKSKVESRAIANSKLSIIEYSVVGGKEYFLSYESRDGKILYGFCRLRIPDGKEKIKSKEFKFLNNSAMIRELHVYGELVPVGDKKKVQHSGLGRKLMAEAEKQARANGFKNIVVIAGVGVREYYRKSGYKSKRGYMIKEID